MVSLPIFSAPNGDGGGDLLIEVLVLVYQGVHLLLGHAAGGAPAQDLDRQGIGTHVGEAFFNIALHTVAQAHDDDDGADADDDAQHGQQGPDLAAEDVLHGHLEGFQQAHAPAPSPVSVGDTTALGARASPS